jgi:hypothetical protein
MPELPWEIPSADPGPEDRPSRVVVSIEAMTEEQVVLLTEDLVELLTRHARSHRPEVASGPP